jgi:hypothetical protein
MSRDVINFDMSGVRDSYVALPAVAGVTSPHAVHFP